MSTAPFTIERTYKAPVNRVWNAISNRDEMKRWYFDLEEFRAEAGFAFSFMGGTEENQYEHFCAVTEVENEKKLVYSWRYKGFEGLSFVSWELFAEGDTTRLKLTHSGLHTFPALADFAAGNFATGWTEITGNMLKKYLEEN